MIEVRIQAFTDLLLYAESDDEQTRHRKPEGDRQERHHQGRTHAPLFHRFTSSLDTLEHFSCYCAPDMPQAPFSKRKTASTLSLRLTATEEMLYACGTNL